MITQEYECTKILNLDPKIANNQNVKYIFISKTKKKAKANTIISTHAYVEQFLLFYFTLWNMSNKLILVTPMDLYIKGLGPIATRMR